MSDFEKEVTKAQEEIDKNQQTLSSNPTSNVGSQSDLQDQFRQLDNLAQMDPSIKEDQVYKDLLAKIEESKHQATEEEEEEDLENEDEQEESEASVDNPFEAEKSKKKVKEIPINFEVPKEFVEVLEKNFGVKDLGTFLNSTQVWRQQAQEASELKKHQEAMENDLADLPYEIKMMINNWADGKDYMEPVLNMKRLDFDNDFHNQDIEGLVEHYLPKEYDELLFDLDNEKIDEEEFLKQVRLLSKATKKDFDRDKQALKTERDEYAQRSEEKHRNFKKSAIVSVEALSKAYPNFSKSELSRVRTTLVEGTLEDIFYNTDGTYKPEAAEFIAFALNGKKILESVKGKAKREGETEANLKNVDTSPKTLKKSKSNGEGAGRVDLSAVSHLSGLIKKDPYS